MICYKENIAVDLSGRGAHLDTYPSPLVVSLLWPTIEHLSESLAQFIAKRRFRDSDFEAKMRSCTCMSDDKEMA